MSKEENNLDSNLPDDEAMVIGLAYMFEDRTVSSKILNKSTSRNRNKKKDEFEVQIDWRNFLRDRYFDSERLVSFRIIFYWLGRYHFENVNNSAYNMADVVRWCNSFCNGESSEWMEDKDFLKAFGQYTLDDVGAMDRLRARVRNIFDKVRAAQGTVSKASFENFLTKFRVLYIIDWFNGFQNTLAQGDGTAAADQAGKLYGHLNTWNTNEHETTDWDDWLEKLINPSAIENDSNSLYLGLLATDTESPSKYVFATKTLNVFVAPTGGGKSMMNAWIAACCAIQGIYCHVVCVEDNSETFNNRVLACLLGEKIHSLSRASWLQDAFKLRSSVTDMDRILSSWNGLSKSEAAAKAIHLLQKYVHVDYMYGVSIDAVHSNMLAYDKSLEDEGRLLEVPTVSVLDYSGHLVDEELSSADKRYEKYITAYRKRKDFALKYKKICFDFMQSNREGLKEVGRTANYTIGLGDIAGSYDMAQVCDNIISLSRTSDESKQGLMRLTVIKGRNGGVNGNEYKIRQDLGSARSINIGEDQWKIAGKVEHEKRAEYSAIIGSSSVNMTGLVGMYLFLGGVADPAKQSLSEFLDSSKSSIVVNAQEIMSKQVLIQSWKRDFRGVLPNTDTPQGGDPHAGKIAPIII